MIEFQSLQKVIDGHTVIDIPELKVSPGEIAALVGPVGSGKGTLLALMTGQTRPTTGVLRLAGMDPRADKNVFNRQIGVLFSEDGLYQNHSVTANLAFFGRLWGISKERQKKVLAEVGLADHADVRVSKLSSGLARRMVFGRAILHAPKVLLLVEPFARCDEASISLIGDLIQKQSQKDATILILANDVAYLTNLCDTIHTLDQGRVVESYRPQEAQRAELPFKVPVRLEGKVALVNPVDILYAEVEDGRAYLQTSEGRLPTQFTLGDLETRLARSGFFRAHRAYLVNLQHVKEVIPYTRNSFSLRLDDVANTEIPLSKTAAGELRSLLDY